MLRWLAVLLWYRVTAKIPILLKYVFHVLLKTHESSQQGFLAEFCGCLRAYELLIERFHRGYLHEQLHYNE